MLGLHLREKLLGPVNHVDLDARGSAVLLVRGALRIQAQRGLVLARGPLVVALTREEVAPLVGKPRLIAADEEREGIGVPARERESLGIIDEDIGLVRRGRVRCLESFDRADSVSRFHQQQTAEIVYPRVLRGE